MKHLPALALLSVFLAMPACSTTSTSGVNTALSNGIYMLKQDAASPQGQAFNASLINSAAAITLAGLQEGKNPEADVAALQAAAGTFNAYSTLPTTTAQLNQVATLGAGVNKTASDVLPALLKLVDAAQQKGASRTNAIQSVASGIYHATSAVSQVAAIGN